MVDSLWPDDRKEYNIFVDKDYYSISLRELAVLLEEYITQQRAEFTLKGLYAYIIYWGMEGHGIEGDQLPAVDKESVNRILERIVADVRIRADGEGFVKANI